MSNFNVNFRINISSSFMHRARCNKCSGTPINSVFNYFFVKNPNAWKDHSHNTNKNKYLLSKLKRMCENYYLQNSPRNYKSISSFNHSVSYNSYIVKMHKNIGVEPFSDFVDFITCRCGFTTWSFYERSIGNRPEIKNKKGKYGY
jgi:hypothetical protein